MELRGSLQIFASEFTEYLRISHMDPLLSQLKEKKNVSHKQEEKIFPRIYCNMAWGKSEQL